MLYTQSFFKYRRANLLMRIDRLSKKEEKSDRCAASMSTSIPTLPIHQPRGSYQGQQHNIWGCMNYMMTAWGACVRQLRHILDLSPAFPSSIIPRSPCDILHLRPVPIACRLVLAIRCYARFGISGSDARLDRCHALVRGVCPPHHGHVRQLRHCFGLFVVHSSRTSQLLCHTRRSV